MIKLLFFASALAWMALNVAGTVMAIATEGTAGHIAAHLGVAAGCGVAAWFLRPRRGSSQPAADGDDRVRVLEAEVSDLQRQLNETQRTLQFTEQLLTERPESRKDESP